MVIFKPKHRIPPGDLCSVDAPAHNGSSRLVAAAVLGAWVAVMGSACSGQGFQKGEQFAAGEGKTNGTTKETSAESGGQEAAGGGLEEGSTAVEDPSSQGDSLDLAGNVFTPPIEIAQLAVSIVLEGNKRCSGMFIAPQVILTAASCAITDLYNWGTMMPIERKITRIFAYPGSTKKTIFDENEFFANPGIYGNVRPSWIVNPSYLKIYRKGGAPLPDAGQHRIATDDRDMPGEKYLKTWFNVALIDLSKNNVGVDAALFSNPKVKIKLLTDPVIAKIRLPIAPIVLGTGQKKSASSGSEVTAVRFSGRIDDQKSYLEFYNRDALFALTYQPGVNGSQPCEGDEGAPLMYEIREQINGVFVKTYQILAVAGEAYMSQCLQRPDGSVFSFTRLDSPATASWITLATTCGNGCNPDRSVYHANHFDFIKGNPIFLPLPLSIDSFTFSTRLEVGVTGVITARCKKDGRLAWKGGVPSSTRKVFAMGVWQKPTPRIIFSAINRDERYFRNLRSTYVNDYLYRSMEWPKQTLSSAELKGFGSFPVPNNNPNGAAILKVGDDGLEMGWSNDTVNADPSRFQYQTLQKISWDRCPDVRI